MKILNIDPLNFSDEAISHYKSIGEYLEVSPINKNELIYLLKDVDVLVMRLSHKIDRLIFESSKKLKVIATNVTGINHIDEVAARECNVKIISLRGEYSYLNRITASAEHTWALLLSLIRNIPQAAGSVRGGQWKRDQFMGIQLYGKKLGVIGFGRNGFKIAHYGQAFGMKVFVNEVLTKKIPPEYTYKTINEIFKTCDVVSINIPFTQQNKRIINADLIGSMKKNAVLINTSRGEVLDEDALIYAIDNHNIWGAALDVVCDEIGKKSINSKIIQCSQRNERLLITPHIGGVTSDSWKNTEIFIAKKTIEFLR